MLLLILEPLLIMDNNTAHPHRVDASMMLLVEDVICIYTNNKRVSVLLVHIIWVLFKEVCVSQSALERNEKQ